MKRRNPRFLVLACAVAALLVVPSLAVAAPGPGLGFAVHPGDSGGSLTAWLGQLGSSLWGVLTYDALQRHSEIDEIEKARTVPDPNGNRRFQRAATAPTPGPRTAESVSTDGD